MRIPSISSSLALVLLAAAACGTTTQFAATNASPRPLRSRPVEEVAVFATGLPQVPFVEIGIIQGNQSSEVSLDEMPDILLAMRRAAARRGCDGLVLNGPRDQSSSSTYASSKSVSVSHTTLEGFWGACIVFVEPVTAAQAATRTP